MPRGYLGSHPGVESLGAEQRSLQQTLDWSRAHASALIFMVSDNGMAWCRQDSDASGADGVLASNGTEGSPAKDSALLTQCNHTITTTEMLGT